MQGSSTSDPGHHGTLAGPAATNGGRVTDAAAEIARLRRRLAFYEGFDDLIQQNISRSGDLLRLAVERQAEAERDLAAGRAELARTAAAQRDVLDALAAELATVRSGLDALAARVDAASAGLARIAATGDGDRPAPPSPDVPGATDAAAQPGSPARQPVAAAGEERRTGSVIVHGIAGVEDARSYQTWLASRPGVQSVTPREFASGILRLDVAAVPFPGVDAAGWPGHALEVVDLGPGATVLRLRGAAGL